MSEPTTELHLTPEIRAWANHQVAEATKAATDALEKERAAHLATCQRWTAQAAEVADKLRAAMPDCPPISVLVDEAVRRLGERDRYHRALIAVQAVQAHLELTAVAPGPDVAETLEEALAISSPLARPGEAPASAHFFDKRGADALAREVKRLIDRKIIDARSPAGDALLDYVNPGPNETVPGKLGVAPPAGEPAKSEARSDELAAAARVELGGFRRRVVALQDRLAEVARLAAAPVEVARADAEGDRGEADHG